MQNPQEIEEKIFKIWGICTATFGPKKCLKNFLAAFGTWYNLQRKFKKTKVVPGSKYGVHGNMGISISSKIFRNFEISYRISRFSNILR